MRQDTQIGVNECVVSGTAKSATYARMGATARHQTAMFSIHHGATKQSPNAWGPDPGQLIQATQMDTQQAACAANHAEEMKGRPSQEEYQRVCMVKEGSKGTSDRRARYLCGDQISRE